MKTWSRPALIPMLLVVSACGEGAKLVQDFGPGGVVVYPYRAEQGTMLSSFRKDAIRLIEEKCPRGYTIVREGETKGRLRQASAVGGMNDVVEERRWGIQFQCK